MTPDPAGKVRRIQLESAVAYVLLVIVLMVASVAISNAQATELWKAQIGACDSGNALRIEVNKRVPASQTLTDVLAKFLTAARKARLAAGQAIDREVAEEYRAAIKRLARDVHFSRVPLVNCHAEIPKP